MATMSLPGTPNTVGIPIPGSPTNRKRKAHISTSVVLLLIFTNGVSFLCGTFHASNAAIATNLSKHRQLPNQLDGCPPPTKCPACPKAPTCPPPKDCPETETRELKASPPSTKGKFPNPFPEMVNRFAVGMTYTTQENFTKTYDIGAPVDHPKQEGDKGVLIIYNTPESLPRRAQRGIDISTGPIAAKEATENCDQMNIVFSHHEGRRKQCTAILPQYESFHIQKWMRVPPKGPATGYHPLRLVPRGYQLSGASAFHPPGHEKHTKKAWKMLETYLDSIDDIIDELTPLVKRIAIKNAIVVMVCNFGQSQLLLNFACSARAKRLDISSVLVFATDQETKELAEAVGLNVYFDERNFGSMPKKAAKTYGDGAFTNMMLSKVICVHMASLLNVDLLFQDADVVWYKVSNWVSAIRCPHRECDHILLIPLRYLHRKNPLTEFFQKKINGTPLEDFDAYFQVSKSQQNISL